MQAVEFETQIEEGIIKVPSQFLQKSSGSVKVILLYEEKNQEQSVAQNTSIFDQVRLKTKGFRFNREEANER